MMHVKNENGIVLFIKLIFKKKKKMEKKEHAKNENLKLLCFQGKKSQFSSP